MSLLRKINHLRPLWLNLIAGFPETTSLVISILVRRVASIISALSVLEPLCLLFCHLWVAHFDLRARLLFFKLCFLLVFEHRVRHRLLVSAPIVTFIAIASSFLLFNNIELAVLLILDQSTACNRGCLLLLLHCSLSWWYESDGLRRCKVRKLPKTVFFVVRLEKLAVKILREVESFVDRAEAFGVKIQTKTVEVEVWAADLVNHS